MKQLLFIIALLAAGTSHSIAQCAIAVCSKTGTWATKYNDGRSPLETLDEMKQDAMKQCQQQGGTACKDFYAVDARGCWCAFMIGTGPDGRFTYRAIAGETTKEEAETAIRKRYIEKGGLNPEGARITSWYVAR